MGERDTGTVWRDGKPQIDHSLLEDQMCSYTGAPGDESPDVLDALVWAITQLMVGQELVGGMVLDTNTQVESEEDEQEESPYALFR